MGYESLMAAVALCRPGLPYAEIGGAIEDVLDRYKLESVREFSGHGIGRHFHALPRVWHYRHQEWPFWSEGVMEIGHTFTIEPMVVMGSAEVDVLDDGWTAVTADG